MASSVQTDPPVFQKFKAENGSPLPSLQSHLCAETGERYLLWTDIQHAFSGIDHLEAGSNERILFTIDAACELHHPLRIQQSSFAYVVIHMTFRKDQIQEFNDGQIDTQDQPLDEIVPSLKHLFDMCIYLYNLLGHINSHKRQYFRQAVANARYYHLMFVEEVEQLEQAGAEDLVDGKDRGQLLEELHDLQQKVPEWEYRNICHHTLYNDSEYEYTTSTLFIVLPSDLNSKKDSNSSTHQFRLYFLCENYSEDATPENLPQYVHLSNHPGYSLKRPEEFFQKYGDYILRVLRMVKHGYTDDHFDIPPLDSLKILWNCDSNIIGSRLVLDIESLVDRAISYFQELSLPKWKEMLGLTRDQNAAIKTYLDVQDGDSTDSNLYRYISKEFNNYQKCEAHAHQSLSSQSLEHLKEFAHRHGGYVDMQQARIGVELGSLDEADQFRPYVSDVKHIFEISVKLNWKLTRSQVKQLCLDIAKLPILSLELDGITLDIHPEGYDQYRNNLFYHDIISKSTLRFISLLNYRRPQERCVHVNQYSLQLKTPPAQSSYDWMVLWSDVDKFREVVLKDQDPSEWKSATTKFQTALEKHDLSGTYMVTIYDDEWNAVIDPKRGVVVEVHSEDMVCPKSVLSAGSIRTLGVHSKSLDFSHEFFSTMRANTELQDLIVSYYGHNILYHMEHIARMWHTSSSPFRLTLLDRMNDTRGRVVAQLAIGRSDREIPSDGTIDLHAGDISPPFSKQQAVHEPTNVVFTQWDCDHVYSKISDYSALFLDMATHRHPSVLTLLMLDVSQLSHTGFSSIREILRRSDLEHLHVVCTPVDPYSESIAQILGSVQWSTLKSLVFAGNNIEAWIDLCQPPFSPSLLSLQIQGTLPNIQELSHSNVLFIFQLISASPMIDLCFQNVQLQECRDWELIVDSVDYSLLKMLDLGAVCIGQLVSMPDAVNLLISRVEQAREDTEGAKLVLRAFTLDITALSQPDLAAVQGILSLCRLDELRVECPPFDPRLSAYIAQVLSSVCWTSLEHLDLTGDSINEWIQLLPNIEIPRLQSLGIQGSGRVEQTLAHSSVLFVEQCIRASPLVELSFGHIQLQDRLDWVRLVESMDLSLVGWGFRVEGSSREQYVGTPEAVQLEQEMWSQWEE